MLNGLYNAFFPILENTFLIDFMPSEDDQNHDEEMSVDSDLHGDYVRCNSADEIPDYVQCPITHQIFREPVTLETGSVVEKGEVNRLTTCPITQEKLTSTKNTPAIKLKQAVEAYLTRHPEKNNPEDRYQEYSSLSTAGGNITFHTPARRNRDCLSDKEAVVSTITFFFFFGGLAVGLYYAIKATPCQKLLLKNLTGGPLDFTYSDTANDDSYVGCEMSPWQNVPSNSSIHVYRGTLLDCTFYTTDGIKIQTTAFSVSADGQDANGCTIDVKKHRPKCTWEFFKECSNTVQLTTTEEQNRTQYLRLGFG